jgi:putative transposase
MQLVEQHCIDKRDPRYAVIDETAFQSKNLYNAALYLVRQSFIFEGKYLNYNKLDKLMQKHEAYLALPRKVSQWVLKGLHHNWQSFFESLKAYKEDPSKFTGRPQLPKYKHKTEGRNLLVYTVQAISKAELRKGIIKPSQLAITVKTKKRCIKQVRIVPKNGFYVVEVVYERAPIQAQVDPAFCVGIDLGVTNLAAIASNRVGFTPRMVNGRHRLKPAVETRGQAGQAHEPELCLDPP